MAETTDTKREVRAEAKWVRVSPRKARVVAQHIRGRSVPEARTVLAFTQRAAAREIEKVLRSAVANAEANHGMVGDDLVIAAAYIDEGPTIKRWRARARGRVARINKRTCHITIKVTTGENGASRAVSTPPPAAPATEEKPKRGAAKPAAEAKPKPARAKKSDEQPAEKPKRSRAKKKTEGEAT